MKKFSVLGLVLSLFAVFALASCSKDEPSNPLNGKVFFKQDVEADDNGTKYIDETAFAFTANQLTVTTKSYREPAREDRNRTGIVVYGYTYDNNTAVIKVTKVISATENGVDTTSSEEAKFEQTKKAQESGDVVISYDKANQRLKFRFAKMVRKDGKEVKEMRTSYFDLKK